MDMDNTSKVMTHTRAEHPHSLLTEQTARDLDQAFWYVENSSAGNDVYPSSARDLKALRRRIDWHIVPIMCCCYTMQFIDKVLLNVRFPVVGYLFAVGCELISKQYAAVMGLNKDLKLKGNDFTNAATAFFIAYLISEVPNGKRPFPLLPIDDPSLFSDWYIKPWFFRRFPSQNGSLSILFSGASRPPALPQLIAITPSSSLASFLASLKLPLRRR